MDLRGCWTTPEEFATHQFDQSVAEIIVQMRVRTAVDIGCGDGRYTDYLNGNNIKCDGFDGSPFTEELTWGRCKIKDFSEPQEIGMYDLVLSLEVGEHIPQKFEQVFIDNLCAAARKFIILSWAVLGQGGTGHVNCRDNDYIIAEMSKRGFVLYKDLTERLRKQAQLSWFKETLMAFIWNPSQ